MLMPLTPQHCFVAYDLQVYTVGRLINNRVAVTKKEDAEAINELQYLNADNNIYFHSWEDRQYTAQCFGAAEGRRIESNSEVTFWVPINHSKNVVRYVKATREQGMQAGEWLTNIRMRYPEPSRWFAPLRFRSSPRTFYNGSLVGHVRRREWLTRRPRY